MNKQTAALFMADLDDFQLRLACGVAALFTTHESMTSGVLKCSEYIDALFGNYLFLNGLVEELREIIDSYYKEENE